MKLIKSKIQLPPKQHHPVENLPQHLRINNYITCLRVWHLAPKQNQQREAVAFALFHPK